MDMNFFSVGTDEIVALGQCKNADFVLHVVSSHSFSAFCSVAKFVELLTIVFFSSTLDVLNGLTVLREDTKDIFENFCQLHMHDISR